MWFPFFGHIKSWRTTLAGIGAIMAAVSDLIAQITQKDFDATRFGADITGIITGVGLLYARDAHASEQAHALQAMQIADVVETAVVAKERADVAEKVATELAAVVEEKP